MNKKLLFAVFCFFILLTIFSRNIPFFWDGTFFSSLALRFYGNGFNGFIAPLSNDTGGFPLYSAYLACAWKVFGKSLLVSHIAMLPFILGTAWEYLKLAKRWLNGSVLILAMLLLIIEPVFITQSILMGYDVLVCYFFLLALNALLDKRKTLFVTAIILLCMISVRGLMLATALLLIDLRLNRGAGYSFLKNYIPALIFVLLWIFHHHSKTGWYIFSPERDHNAESFAGPKMILRQLIYIAWKNLDIGRITLWLTLLVGYRYFLKKTKDGNQLLSLILIPLLTLSVFMCLIKNPIAPKYFMVVFLLLNIGGCLVIQHLEKRNTRLMIFSSIAISLVCGNFILYPQRFGNTWDSTIKILPYFDAKNEMDHYIETKNVTEYSFATQFPLNAIADPNTLVPFWVYRDLDSRPVEEWDYFLYSNVINTNRMADLEKIKNTWIKEKEIRTGQIILILYRNPGSFRETAPGLSLRDRGTTDTAVPASAMP
ncbi:MAG: hypothetical protein ACJ77K_15440 [Bacteroidia bacterium]